MLAIVAAIIFAVGFVLRIAGASLGRMDALAWALLGLFFLALHCALNWWPVRRPPAP